MLQILQIPLKSFHDQLLIAVGEGEPLGQLTGGMGFQADQLSMFSQSSLTKNFIVLVNS